MNSVSSGRGAGRAAKSDGGPPFAKRAPASAFKGVNERTSFFTLCLVGRSVTVKTTDGHKYTGLFYAMKETDQGEMHLILSHASQNGQQEVIPYAVIPYNVFSSLSAEEVDLAGQDISAKPFTAVAGFEDSANALDHAGNERKLQAFVFDADIGDVSLEEAAKSSATGGWSGNDMFAENERRFGVTATFKESMYTTALEGANISAEEAQRLANSILAEQGTTVHEREERGQTDDSGLTEEDKYGAVLRQAAPNSAAAVHTPAPPPADSADAPPVRAGTDASASGSNGAARSERQEINAVRRKLAEGKSLTDVAPQLRTKYVNDAPAVDALNLMPGSGSHQFRKDKVSNVAHRLDVFKSKRLSGSNNTQPAAATAAAAVPPAADGAASALGSAVQPGTPGSGAVGSGPDRGSDGRPETAIKLNPDAAPFSFNPKSVPFMPGKKLQESSAGGEQSQGAGSGGRKGGQRERGDGVRGGRGRQGRNHDGGYGGHHAMPRQGGGGFMYGGAPMGMGPQNMQMNMMMTQGIQAGPRGMPMHQMAGGTYPPNSSMHYHHLQFPMSNPMGMAQPMGMANAQMVSPGGFLQPMQPGFTPPTGQSPPGGYVPPPNV